MTATSKRKTVRELLAEQADSLVPVDGDRAFTLYHGLIWEGVLKKIEWNGKWGGTWVIVPVDGKELFDHREGYYKYFEKMSVANVGVYAPDDYSLERDEDDDYDHEEFGMSADSKKSVRFDIVRGMFYLRAQED
jgi:hypothetical protein